MTLPSVESERLIFVASFKRWPVAPVLPCLSDPWAQTVHVTWGQCLSTWSFSFPGKYFIFSDTYSKINQMKLSHAHNLVSIYALFTAFNGDGEDCVRAGAVLIHVGGTNRPWLKINRLKQSLIESQGTKWSLWLFCLRFLLPRVINLSMSSALYTTYPGRSLMYTPTSGLSFTCDDETQLYHTRLYMQMP